ncbi:hypothetical protein [Serratia fonticola]|uniref:hypothetical protein n=1 Tax=Serratia fonticola TaxID=47917 RepID=UPI00192CE9D6|nr:hypothetical protein [Serratia fonticola]MBL5829222.1 hypothetical protein [Serratia fonticola]
MKKATALSALIRRWQSIIILMLTIGFVTTPAMAILSDKAGQIQGQAPAVTGNVQVLFPDGETVLTDNAVLELNQILNQFRVSSSTAGLVLQDADGDTGLAALVDIEHANLSWKYNGTALTSAQLAASFRDNFAGQTLTLDVSAPVTVSSKTGLPTTAEPRLLTKSYTLTVASEFSGISVNGHTFGMTEGFPSTGFTGARFALNVRGVASDYAWDNGGSSWVTVDDSGNVAFTDKGNSTPVTITATPKGGGAPLTYTFSVNTWFINNGSTGMSWSDASNWCTAQGLTQPTKDDMTLGTNVRGIGSLWSEWGRMGKYSGSDFVNDYYWTSELEGVFNKIVFYYVVHLYDGDVDGGQNSSITEAVCRQGI